MWVRVPIGAPINSDFLPKLLPTKPPLRGLFLCLEEMMSLATSRKQSPRVINIINQVLDDWVDGLTVLNFGCGKWPMIAAEKLREHGAAKVWNYDPNLHGHPFATDNFADVSDRFYDVVVCANVMNVIHSSLLLRTLEQIKEVNAGVYVFSVYEGDKTGDAKDTRDGHQRNLKLIEYLPDIYSVFQPRHIDVRYNAIVVTP